MDLVARAPAKVNLVLRVGRLRPDGYHDVGTLLAPLDLCDEVRVRVAPGRRGPVTCRVPGRRDLDGPRNLAARAAEAFRLRLGVRDAVAIRIAKRIPVTAGLGGGSSDAAAVIRCLARAYRLREAAALLEVATAVGSDVPFFLGRGPAWATGRGERLLPVRLAPLDLVLAYPRDPALAIRAADAYRWLDEARGRGARRRRRLARPLDLERFRPGNDLEGPALARLPSLAAIRGVVAGAGALSAIMSGSGPTVVGVFASRTAARGAAAAIRGPGAPGLEIHVARTLQRLPGVAPWRSPRSASSPSTRRSSRPT
ncbi:MAG TPA: 4-(cytidine 5'-diphospho)-2-C-methyl-D-erythritol kinase [Anaeromyxobacteraceae bacterium]|jgi:4-diphosphocytidyl-2-C-methyl-D-erythritol kinase